MKELLKLFLSSLPVPKTNKYMRRKNGKVFKHYKVVKWEKKAIKELEKQYQGEPINFPIKVEVFFFLPDKRKRDIDNMLKTLWDVLEKAGIISNDFLIYETRTVKIFSKEIKGTIINLYVYEENLQEKEELILLLKRFNNGHSPI